MTTRVGKSFEYNTICPVCGFKKKNWELRKRWDGIWVCKEDWEERHPMDFYRTRNDAHKLPFTLTDTGENSATPTFTGRTIGGTGVTDTATWKVDSINSKVTFTVTITPTDSTSYTTTSSATVDIPLPIVINGTVSVFTKNGVFLGTGVVSGASANLPNWTEIYDVINITGTYGI